MAGAVVVAVAVTPLVMFWEKMAVLMVAVAEAEAVVVVVVVLAVNTIPNVCLYNFQLFHLQLMKNLDQKELVKNLCNIV